VKPAIAENIYEKRDTRFPLNYEREERGAYFFINVSVWSHVSNFQTSFSVIGLLWPCFMSGVNHPKNIPCRGK